MIQSVQGQSHKNWELCLADGSDAEHAAVGEAALACAAADPCILYRKLSRNGGISENTNAYLDMATGDFIALFNHDDLLHPPALFEVVTASCEQNAVRDSLAAGLQRHRGRQPRHHPALRAAGYH